MLLPSFPGAVGLAAQPDAEERARRAEEYQGIKVEFGPGIAFHTLVDASYYGRADSFDPNNKPTSVTFVPNGSHDDLVPSFSVMAHVLWAQPFFGIPYGCGFSFGIATDKALSAPILLFGPTFAIGTRQRGYITLGWAFGKVKRLNGVHANTSYSLHPTTGTPADENNPLVTGTDAPLSDQYRFGRFISITFNL